MTYEQIRTHTQILGWLHIIGHALFLVIGAFVFVLMAGIGLVSADAEALGVLGIIGAFVAGLMLLLAVPGLLAGWGLLTRKSWARYLALIIGILNLFNFPLGTVVGIYTLYVLLQDEASAYFSGLKGG